MFSEKTITEKLACEILTGILSIPHQPTCLTQRHKKLKIHNVFQKEFEKELTYEQIKDFEIM